MPTLEDLIAALPARPDAAALVEGFVPPDRFAAKRFESYHPRHPTQEAARERLRAVAASLRGGPPGVLERLRARWRGGEPGRGVYLDGGFGVGKTHLLAALWHEAPAPKSYLSFDELVHFIGLVGVGEARAAFAGRRLVAVDEWELDDPGNLKIALAFLRGVLADGVHLAVTSNTLPLELGEGRFSQKDFRAEIEELAGAFEIVRVEGDDYRHRHFEADPGRDYFLDAAALDASATQAGPRAVRARFPDLLAALERVHPIRYAALVERMDALLVECVAPMERLPDALRWVHLVDSLYDADRPFAATSTVPLGGVFPRAFLTGPYGKKVSRCLSRMEEMLGERR